VLGSPGFVMVKKLLGYVSAPSRPSVMADTGRGEVGHEPVMFQKPRGGHRKTRARRAKSPWLPFPTVPPPAIPPFPTQWIPSKLTALGN
jgi:hypothetical protein